MRAPLLLAAALALALPARADEDLAQEASAALQCALSDLEAADADAPAQDQSEDEDAAVLPRLTERLRRLAGTLEFYAHPSFVADPGMQALLRRAFPAEVAPFLRTRRQALSTVYASLAVADLYALERPLECPSSGRARWAILAGPPGLFTTSEGAPTAWLSFLYRASRASSIPSQDEDEEPLDDASDEDAAAYALSLGRARGLTERLARARGKAAQPLLCERARAYAELAAAHQPAAADESEDEDEAPPVEAAGLYQKAAPSVVFVRAGGSGRRAAAAGAVVDASAAPR
jgi:hypothetical protein